MIKPGTVVTVDFAGTTGIKRRPALVISTELYHQTRPDVIIAVLTSQITSATKPSDYILRDWRQAGLHRSSAFRTFLNTVPKTSVTEIGNLSSHDWVGVQQALQLALAVQ